MFVYVPKKSGNGRKTRGNSHGRKPTAPQKKPSVPSPQPSRECQPARAPPRPVNTPQRLPIHPAPPRPQPQPIPALATGPPPPAQYSSSALVPSNVNASAPKLRNKKSSGRALIKAAKSTADLNKTIVKDSLDEVQQQWKKSTAALTESTAACDVIAAKFNAILTSIDAEGFSGREEELHIWHRPNVDLGVREVNEAAQGGGREASRAVDKAVSTTVTSPKSTNVFAKVNMYANSRLPPWLPPLKLYLPTYPLICLAAQFSERVYTKPAGKEKETHVDSDWRMGTKAMVIKSVPMDDMNAVVIAIRGSQTFMDWAVNLNSEPASPQQFLDDPGNMCHSGFLSVAKKMVGPIAARLRSLLEEDPSRSSCSLIMTGHSAGGAVASLLYAHMLGQTTDTRSELSILAGCFKRIHCITFGAPPVSLLPLSKPQDRRYHKYLFLSFINEGDPVPRADKPYIRSLLDLYARPTPKIAPLLAPFSPPPAIESNKPKLNAITALLKPSRPKLPKTQSAPANIPSVSIWRVPPCILSNAGRCVVLRPRPRVPGSSEPPPPGNGNGGGEAEDDVIAQIVTDSEMRGVIWGDPVMHMMRVYRRRVEVLATRAVTGPTNGWS